MTLSTSDCISIAGVVATIILGIIALWQNSRYKKQSDNFIDLQSMPELFPVRSFDFGLGKIMEKMPTALQADISDSTGSTLYFSIFYAENGPIYDLTISQIGIDGNCMNHNLTCNHIDIYPMNKYLQFSLIVPSELINDKTAHKGQGVFSYKNQYNVEYEKKFTFDFAGTQIGVKKMERAERVTSKFQKSKIQSWIQHHRLLRKFALCFSKETDGMRQHTDFEDQVDHKETGEIINMWTRIKDFFNKHQLLFAIIIILLSCTVIPLFINIAFKQNWGIPWLQAEWTADDALSFYGSILGAVMAITGVKWTIDSTLKAQEKERIMKVKPCLCTSTLLISTDHALDELDGQNTWFIFNTPSDCYSQKGMPARLKNKPNDFESQCIIKYDIKNVGANTATRLEMFLEDIPSLPKFAMQINDAITVVLVLAPKNDIARKDYKIRLCYGDIISESRYTQEESLTVINEGNDVTYEQALEQSLSSPKLEEV